MAEQSDMNVNQLFDFFEKTTSGFLEKLSKDDNLLKIMSKWRDNALDFKNYFDKVVTEVLKNMNLPNKRDQDKTLHKINMLESQISDLTERVEKLANKKKPGTGASSNINA